MNHCRLGLRSGSVDPTYFLNRGTKAGKISASTIKGHNKRQARKKRAGKEHARKTAREDSMQDESEELAIHPLDFSFAALAMFLMMEVRVPDSCRR